MPRVISYTRFSTKKQARGHSKERQDDKAIKWCLANGYELDLDASIHDPGFSAYAGDNFSKGALGVLQRACIEGKLEAGTILLIEAFDRFTRLPLPKAYEMLLTLINNGLTIVTLTDGKVWTEKSMKKLEDFMLSLVTLYRGYQESEHKSTRLQETFEAARKKKQQASFGSAPGWLIRETKESPWQVDLAKAESVRRVFDMAIQGYGSKAIAQRANKEGWVVPTRLNLTGERWHSRMPGMILRNRAVTGHHEHRIRTHEAHSKDRRGLPTGVIHHDYYPRIISDELFAAARASIETRSGVGRRDVHYYNIFSGLMYCGHCGSPIHRKTEQRGNSKATLVCADKVAGVSACPPCAASTADTSLLEALFKHTPATSITDEQQAELVNLEADIREKQEELQRITDTITKVGPLDALTDKLTQLSFELDIHRISREALLAARESLGGQTQHQAGLVGDALAHLYAPGQDSRDYRAALRMRLARQVETIWLFSYEVAIIEYKHTHAREVVELQPKRLPSRMNPDAPHHKPPKPRATPARPHLEAARMGTLPLPAPRKQVAQPRVARNDAPALDSV